MVTFFREVPGSGGRVYFSDAPQVSDVKNIFSPAGIEAIISLDHAAGETIVNECPKYRIKQYFYHINPAAPVPGATRLAKDIKNITMKTPVLIHCFHGQDRTGFGIALWLVQVTGYQPCQAIKFVEMLTGFGLGITPKAKDQLKAIVGCIESDTNLALDAVEQMRDELAHGQGYAASGTVDGGTFGDHLSFAPFQDPNGDYSISKDNINSYENQWGVSARIKILKMIKIAGKKKKKTDDKNNGDFDSVPAGMPGQEHASAGVDEKLPAQILLPDNGQRGNWAGLSENFLNAPSGSPGAPNSASPSQPSGLVQM